MIEAIFMNKIKYLRDILHLLVWGCPGAYSLNFCIPRLESAMCTFDSLD